MTPADAYAAWLAVYAYAAATVAVMCLIAGLHHLWVNRLIGHLADDPVAEYEAAAADRADAEWAAITAAVDPDFVAWEQEVSS